MFSKKVFSLLVMIAMFLLSAGYCEKIAWLTGLEISDSWNYVGFRVNVYDLETRTIKGYDVPCESTDVYFLNGRYEGDPLIAITENNELSVHRFDDQAIGEEVFRTRIENEIWAMSYSDGWVYAIEYCFTEDGYQMSQLVRMNGSEKETICDALNIYDFQNPGDDRLIVSENNDFAWFENTGMDESKTITTGVTVLLNDGGRYSREFIPLFGMEYPYHQYAEQLYYTVAPAMCWLDHESLLCFLVRQEIDENFPGTSCNDAVVVNVHTGEAKPYLMEDGSQLVIKDYIFSGFQTLLMENGDLILQIDEEYSLYPTAWWGSSLPRNVGRIAMSDARASQLTRYSYGNESVKEVLVENSMIFNLD